MSVSRLTVVLIMNSVHKQRGGCDAAKPNVRMLERPAELIQTNVLAPCVTVTGNSLVGSLSNNSGGCDLFPLPPVDPRELAALHRIPIANGQPQMVVGANIQSEASEIVAHLLRDECQPSSSVFGHNTIVERTNVYQPLPLALFRLAWRHA